MSYKQQNWGKLLTWFPEEIHYPASLEELRQKIAKARKEHVKIRIAGSLHTMNPLCATSGIQIHTDKLCKVMQIDKNRQTVKVQAGIKIAKLLHILAKEGLTLPNQGYITDQSIAGAIATATHGSGKTGTLSSFVLEIEILNAEGDLLTLTPADNEHLFSAAVVNLGCLGIVYSVTLRCIPLQKLHLLKERNRIAPVFDQLPKLLQNNDYFQFMVNPYCDETLTYSYRRTEEPFHHRWWYKIHRQIIKSMIVVNMDISPTPYWIMPAFIKFYMRMSSTYSFIDYSHKILSPADEGHYVEEEIAVPLESLENAFNETSRILTQFSNQKMRLVLVILIRFADPDIYGYLSPAIGRQTAYISLITLAKEGYKDIFRQFETALYPYEGRPHWGKIHFLTKDAIAHLYGNNYALFKDAKHKMDPQGLFSNDYTETLF